MNDESQRHTSLQMLGMLLSSEEVAILLLPLLNPHLSEPDQIGAVARLDWFRRLLHDLAGELLCIVAKRVWSVIASLYSGYQRLLHLIANGGWLRVGD